MELPALLRGAAHRVTLWVAFLALYLLFAGSISPAEAVVGGVAAAGATALAMTLHRRFPDVFAIELRWLPTCCRIIPAIFSESWLLLRALVRRMAGRTVTGRFLEYPYPPVPDDGHGAARFAVVAFGVCVTPNSYLVGIDASRRKVLVRQLVGRELSGIDRAFLVLG